jgi:hypothetical protein
MDTDLSIQNAIEIINIRTEDINNLLNHWIHDRSEDNRQDFNNHTNSILGIFEQFVDIIRRTPDDRYVRLARNLYDNLNSLLRNMNNILGHPTDVTHPLHQIRTEIGLLDKTQRITSMMNTLDAYINRHIPSGGGSRKYKKSKKIRKIRKTRKPKRKDKKTKRVR